jgi:hypothetical protein
MGVSTSMLRSLSLLIALAWPLSSHAILFYDTADGTHNTTAPTGAYEHSGWAYQGLFGSFMGTAISPTQFITAAHIGLASSSFSQPTTLTGDPSVTHNIDTTANAGQGYWDITGTDLRIYQITGSIFTSYAPLYTGTDEALLPTIITGRGAPRQAAVSVGSEHKGWQTGVNDGVVRWGVNQVAGTTSIPGLGDLLYAEFNAVSGVEEAHLSLGDSGGSMFVNDGGTWKLAGIHYAVDGAFSLSPTGSSPFHAALFDIGGLSIQTGPDWTPVPEDALDIPSAFYSTRVSSNILAISSITAVPEPSSALLVLTSAGLTLLRRRRKAQF